MTQDRYEEALRLRRRLRRRHSIFGWWWDKEAKAQYNMLAFIAEMERPRAEETTEKFS